VDAGARFCFVGAPPTPTPSIVTDSPLPTAHPDPHRDELDGVRAAFDEIAADYFSRVDGLPAIDYAAATAALEHFRMPLPEQGTGAEAALRELYDQGLSATGTTSGPRFYHWVVGGSTPAATGADWLTTLLDNPAFAWVGSPLTVELETLSLEWLKELFGLDSEMTGIMVTGASMANFVGMAAARQWWGECHGVDVSEHGLVGLPKMPVLTSGYVHASAVKVLSLLGVGRSSIERHTRDAVGAVDLASMEESLKRLDGAPAVLMAVAGEVNAGDFDPIEEMADLAERYGAWLHVDGAFGLFAAVSDRTRAYVRGVERADSVTVDGHKWLNVPYDSGYAFVRDREILAKAFAYTARYLSDPSDPRPVLGGLGPESSRRARALAVWATLRAYGRDGYRRLFERHLDLAAELVALVDAAPELERLADSKLSVVCFRLNPGDRSDEELNALNQRWGALIFEDGRVAAGVTEYGGRTALRPAMVNWRTRSEDVVEFVDVIRELAATLP
jgi:glutamate/tyrosine decarboxylase-like PLP-dependent enzyme